jgi:hypothetical protein
METGSGMIAISSPDCPQAVVAIRHIKIEAKKVLIYLINW